MGVGIKLGLYRQAKILALNVAGVSERALCEYVDRLDNGSGQSCVLVATNGTDGSNDTSDDTADDTDANDDTEAEYADTPTEEVLDDYRQFATSVLDRGENTVDFHTCYTGGFSITLTRHRHESHKTTSRPTSIQRVT